MSEIEKNKQAVQAGLNKRKAKRKQAIIDAEQDAITNQMINMVNQNANKVRQQSRTETVNPIPKKAKRISRKKLTLIQQKRYDAIYGACMAVMFFSLNLIGYATEVITIWNIVVTTILSAIIFLINVYGVISNTIKLTRLV